MQEIILGSVRVNLMHENEALGEIASYLKGGTRTDNRPLAIASANLDHVHHFGQNGASADVIDSDSESVNWRVLLDGAPLVWRARQLTGVPWPRLAGSDLIEPVLDVAQRESARVGFLGGLASTHERLCERLARTHPDLVIAGTWAPERGALADDAANRQLATEVRGAGCDLLVVGLGKPRQERWIERYGVQTGARVLLAFGAAADFLAGVVERAPNWARQNGLEWAYRLYHEPRRLARRYVVQGPAAASMLLRHSRVGTS